MIYKYNRCDQIIFDKICDSLEKDTACFIDEPYSSNILDLYKCALSVRKNVLYNSSTCCFRSIGNKTEIVFEKLFTTDVEYKIKNFDQIFYPVIKAIKRYAGDNTYNRIISAYIYLIENVSYGFSTHCYNAWGALVDKKAVCQGISYAFSWLLNEMSISCGTITGTACSMDTNDMLDHCWNIVEVDGDYYHIDVTWGLINNHQNKLSFDYFMLTDSEISVDHYWDHYYIPPCQSMKYNYFILNQLYATSKKGCEKIIYEQLKKNKGIVYLRFSFEEININDILNTFVAIAIKCNININKFSYRFNEKVKTLQIIY